MLEQEKKQTRMMASGEGQLPTVDIAIIGGTGVYGVEGMTDRMEISIDTPFGPTSSKIMIGTVEGEQVAFIARHDVNHRLTPTEVPYKANIWALKSLGVKYLLSFGAVGSLQEQCKPLDIVLPDQFIDRTKNRPSTFFENGIVGHVAFGEPVCKNFRQLLKQTIDGMNLTNVVVHGEGTYVTMEGPAFSTKAESKMYRLLGGTVIGMTALQEAKLAREAEIAYGLVSFVTDYDAWHDVHEHVSVEMVIQTLKQNGKNAQYIAIEAVKALKQDKFKSDAHDALRFAVMTHEEHVPEKVKSNLKPLLQRYFKY